MFKGRYLVILVIVVYGQISAQEASLKGKVVDARNFEPLANVAVTIENTILSTITTSEGKFEISTNDIPAGAIVLVFSAPRFTILRLPVFLEDGAPKDLDVIPLERDMFREQLLLGTINLGDDQLSGEEGNVDNVAGLLQASRDVFLNAAAFDFSQTFFRPRGLDSEFGKVYINGIEMNKLFNGRPQWSNWGGLNDVQRNQQFSMGSLPSEVGFGGLAGSTNILMRAAKFSNGGRISYAAANRSYTGRVMATYNSGETPGGWAYSISLSRRFAEEAFVEGTLYSANAFFLAVEKSISPAHSLNLTAFYTPNIRGRSSANTQEVFDLRGQRYNSFWGYQNGEIRNSRLREIKEPVFMLNHYWKLSDKTDLNTNLAYQFGRTGNSRIDYGGTRLVIQQDGQESFIGGGGNPDPSYYQNLPSYFLRFDDNQNFEAAYRARENFIEDGQIDWQNLYTANLTSTETGGNSIYVIAEDRNDDHQITANSLFTAVINSSTKVNSKVKYTSLTSHNFAAIKDLLGGTGYLDVDFFAEGDAATSVGDRAQSDLQNRNRLVTEREPYKYNFELHADVFEAYSQLQYKSRRADLYAAGQFSQSQYQRTGLFQNGSYPQNSLGKSEKLQFSNYGVKLGGTYKLTGRHLLNFNSAYYTRAPNLRNSFSNSRQNNNVVQELTNESLSSVDVSYIYRTPHFRTRITGYLVDIADATEISFYYADGLSGLGRSSSTAFVQEVLRGIGKKFVGIELGLDYQVTSTIKLKGAAAFGQHTYNNDPQLYLTSDSFSAAVNYGTSTFKNYFLAGGPQRAAQIGFEYRDPNYWWFGTTVNYFSHAFSDISSLTRTSNFFKDVDGLPLIDYNKEEARDLLRQEQFDDYLLVNLIGGKSWRINSHYLGFFVSLNNIFNVLYKTGGFEQARNANFRTLKQDREREQPIFGNKYWHGTGATYYANAYFRF